MRRFVLAILALLVIPASAQAFGAKGHKLIADLAYERLSPKAKSQVDALLALAPQQGTPQCPADTIEGAAVWADCVRTNHVTQFANLVHFEKIPMCTLGRQKPPCPNGRCLSSETNDAINTLRNTSGASVERLQALEVVIHFIGDAHQPLHTVSAWGNTGHKINVDFPGESGRSRTIHQIWDKELVLAALNDYGGVNGVRSQMNANASTWARGSINDWVQESHNIGVSAGYSKLGLNGCGLLPRIEVINQSYISANAKVEQQQLAKAAIRLAYTLNGIFK